MFRWCDRLRDCDRSARLIVDAMLDPVVATLTALVVGLCVGSFLNVVAGRLPQGVRTPVMAPLTSVFPAPRVNMNVDASAAEAKNAFAYNRYANVQPRRPDDTNGSDLIENHAELSRALKECARLRAGGHGAHVADGMIWIRAARNIDAGEELTYNYHTDGDKTIRCRCRPGCPNWL